MNISQEGINLIKNFEGIRLTAYKALPTEEYYTIGIGHYGPDVHEGMTISEARAEELFKSDVKKFEDAVTKLNLKLNQGQFDALVSFAYNCGAGNLRKLTSGRSLSQIADALPLYNKAGGKVLTGLTRRRQAERELFLRGGVSKTTEVKTDVIIGSARSDENKKYQNGMAGDQRQTSVPDYSGEVSMQKFYNHSKGWYVLRPKNPTVAMKIAEAMIRACNNKNIGYDQIHRLGIVAKGTKTTEKTECDCGTLVRVCVKEASGIDPGNFTTATEASLLKATGLFEEKFIYKAGVDLCTGDVLVTRTKGHTAIVTSGKNRNKTNEEIAIEVIDGKWGNGAERRTRLERAGYDYKAVQLIVNQMLKK